MFWQKIREFLKSVWRTFTNRKTSGKCDTTLDTVLLKVFGLEIKVTREVPVGVPYELTVVVPRAEIRGARNNREIILSSITIAHSPRFANAPAPEKPASPQEAAA